MSEFDNIADDAITDIQITFGDVAVWKPKNGGSHEITLIVESTPDPLGDIGGRLDVAQTVSVRIPQLNAVTPGARLGIGDTLEVGEKTWTVDAQIDDDGIEQVVSVK